MKQQFFIAVILFILSVSLFILWYWERKATKLWKQLEKRQAVKVWEYQKRISEIQLERETLDKFRREVPGMEICSDFIAREVMRLRSENRQLSDDLHDVRLQAAKYMDLYRQARYQPKRKHT
jgi:hypothetical protein